jgi:hypothetical protein
MKFKDMPYSRIDGEEAKKITQQFTQRLKDAKTY